MKSPFKFSGFAGADLAPVLNCLLSFRPEHDEKKINKNKF